MIAIFWDFGIMAVDKQRLTISVISGSNSSMQTFNNHVGIGSNSHDVVGDLSNIDYISSSVAGVKNNISVVYIFTSSSVSVIYKPIWLLINVEIPLKIPQSGINFFLSAAVLTYCNLASPIYIIL